VSKLHKVIAAITLASLALLSYHASSSSSSSSSNSYSVLAAATEEELDKFGIERIYPTKGEREWYVNMDDPKSDPNFRNLENTALQRILMTAHGGCVRTR
jgi:hypothetical protein